MQFTFKIKESFYQIWKSMEAVGKDRGSLKLDKGYKPKEHIYSEDETAYRLEEEDFNSFANVIVAPYNTHMKIVTAWSCQSYSFDFTQEQTVCTYTGAFQGFLAQDLFPKLSPVIQGDEIVEASNFLGNIREYVAKKQVEIVLKNILSGYIHGVGLEDAEPAERHQLVAKAIKRVFSQPRTLGYFDKDNNHLTKTEAVAGSWVLPRALDKFALRAAPRKVEYQCNKNHALRTVNGSPVGYRTPRDKKEEYEAEILTTYSITIQ